MSGTERAERRKAVTMKKKQDLNTSYEKHVMNCNDARLAISIADKAIQRGLGGNDVELAIVIANETIKQGDDVDWLKWAMTGILDPDIIEIACNIVNDSFHYWDADEHGIVNSKIIKLACNIVNDFFQYRHSDENGFLDVWSDENDFFDAHSLDDREV